jgi:hypothetical protein
MTTRPKIAFVAGPDRSGSTLLECILGQLEDIVAVGEVWWIWQRGYRDRQLCGCGTPFHECPFWQDVTKRAFDDPSTVDEEVITALRKKVARYWYLLPLTRPAWRWPAFRERLDAYTRILERLYGAIGAVSRARCIVDTSKDPRHGFVLAAMRDLDVFVIHLVRDSRAVSYSWQKSKPRPEIHWEQAAMRTLSPARSARIWNKRNFFSEALGRATPNYLRVRYEDFCRAPGEQLAEMLGFLGEDPAQSRILEEGFFQNRAIHSVSGNPVRFQQGRLEIQPDLGWQEKMNPASRRVVTALTWPLLVRYGYLGKK